MKFKTVLGAAAASLLVAGALAQPYGWGMGPGMMGGAGPWVGSHGMGPGMMGGPGWGYGSLKLSDEQRSKIAAIQESTSKAMWALMGTMHEQRSQMFGTFPRGATDDAAARKAYDAMAETRKAMFELQLDARRKMDAVLTQEQREQLRR